MQMNFSMLKKLFIVGMLFFALGMQTNFAFIRKGPLTADQAFQFSTVVKNPKEFIAIWQIAPGYYLYKEHFKFTFDRQTAYEVQYPPAQFKETPTNQKVEVYADELKLPVFIKAGINEQPITFTVSYQGCSKNGFCYPPMEKKATVDLNKGTSSLDQNTPNAMNFSLSTLLKNQHSILTVLYTNHFSALVLIFIALGILLAFTPCVLPMIPILTGIIVGQSTVTTRKAFLLSLTYILGSAITYAIAGMIAAAMGSSLQVWLQQTWIIVLTSALFFILAFSLFGYYDLRLPNRFQHRILALSNKQKGGTYIGVFIMGVLSTLIVSPCVTAPLVGILMYIGETGNLWFGGIALFALGLGMGLPLVLVGVSAGKWMPKSGPWMEAVKKLFGLSMVGMSLWLLSRVLPPLASEIAWAGLVLAFAIFFGIHLPKLVGRPTLHRIIGALVAVVGSMLVVGASGITPLQWMQTPTQTSAKQIRSFIVVHNIDDLKKQLALAKQANKPVLLDFYADWCDSCVAMDRNVFNRPDVQSKLTHYTLLRADLSANTAMDEALLRRYDVIAPPTILFFDQQGQEMNKQRIVGEVDATEFVDHMTTLWNKIALKN